MSKHIYYNLLFEVVEGLTDEDREELKKKYDSVQQGIIISVSDAIKEYEEYRSSGRLKEDKG